MQLIRIGRALAFVGLLVACGAGGAGTVEGADDPAGPFSGMGNPGASRYRNPGVFSGPGSPGVGGANDISAVCAGVCLRVGAICPASNSDQEACVATCVSDWTKLTTDCARGLSYGFMTCLLSASIVCNDKGLATTDSCAPPAYSQCGGTGTTGGNSGGSGGSDTGGSGGSGGSSTGGGDTGGSGGNGGSGGAGTGGSTGGRGGSSTGGSGGNTGGSGGVGGGGTGGTGGGGRGGRDAGRG